jgi:hypothetical protein
MPTTTTEQPRRRNTDTTAATAARTLNKHRRWAEEMRAAGWTVEEPASE